MTEALLLEPRSEYDQFLIGLDFDGDFFVYDGDRIIEHLTQKNKGIVSDPYTSALEYFNHNIIGSYLGKHTPRYITKEGLP